MHVIQFRITEPGNPEFLCEITIPAHFYFLDLHNYLVKILGLDPTTLNSFFTTNAKWEPKHEISLLVENDEKALPISAMEEVQLLEIVYAVPSRFIYTYGLFQDAELHLEVTKISEEPQADENPTCIKMQGAIADEEGNHLLKNLDDIEELRRALLDDDDAFGDEE